MMQDEDEGDRLVKKGYEPVGIEHHKSNARSGVSWHDTTQCPMTLSIRKMDASTEPNIFNALHRSTRKVQQRPAKPLNQPY